MIVTCLEITTAHLRFESMRVLTELSAEQRMGNGWPAMTVANYQHGVFVTVPEKNADTIDQLENLPDDLGDVLDHARSHGVTLVRFDSDAPQLADLPYYDW